jgi:hypothetical protein
VTGKKDKGAFLRRLPVPWRHTAAFIGAAVSICLIFLVLFGVLNERGERGTALRGRVTGFGAYGDGDGGKMFLLTSGDNVWGFAELPSLGLMGRFFGQRGAPLDLRVSMDAMRGKGGFEGRLSLTGDRLLLKAANKEFGTVEVRLRREKSILASLVGFGFEASADGRGRPLSRIRTLLDSATASRAEKTVRGEITSGTAKPAFSFSLYGFDIASGNSGSTLFGDAHRRGLSPVRYAALAWKEFLGNQAARNPIVAGMAGSQFLERQYLIYRTGSILCTATERYLFEGGAHGNTAVVHRILDLDTGKLLGIGDIFGKGWEGTLPTLIEASARRALGLGEGLSLKDAGFFEDAVLVSGDLFVCASGIGFHYDRYALAPYSMGDFDFILGWRELGGLVRADFLRAAGLP